MTSHITVSASQSSTSTTGFSTPTSSGSGDQSSGGFGALLDAIGSFGKSIAGGAAQGTDTAAPKTGFVQPGSAATTAADAAATAQANAEAVAKALATGTASAPLAATAGTDATGDATDSTAGTPPKLLSDLINSLAELQKDQQDGTPVDADLLKRVKKAIDAISNFLTAQQPIQAAAADPATTSTGTPATSAADPTTASSSANTDAAKATLAALTTKLEALSSSVSQTAPDVSAKLDALAKSLDAAKLSADTMTQLGLDTSGTSADPDLAAAINGFVNGKTTAPTALPQPALAAPSLKLPEGTALSDGKAGTTTPQTSTSGVPAATATSGKTGGSGGDTTDDPSQKSSQSSTPVADAAHAAADRAKDVADTPADTSTSTAATAPQAAATITAQAQLAQTAYTPATAAAAAVTLPQLAVEITRHVQQGDSHFQIKLDPADLGRVDVKLAFDSSGAVSARVTVERPETLALLQRDAGSLSQALTQPGVDSSKTNLQFSLSQNPFAGQNGTGGNGNSSSQPHIADNDDANADTIAPASVAVLYRGTASSSGLNIVV